MTTDRHSALAISRRALIGALAAPLVLPSAAIFGAIRADAFDFARDGATDDARTLARAIIEAGRADRPLALPRGTYALGSAALDVEGIDRVRIECEEGARIVDLGREIEVSSGRPRRAPWGMAFRACGAVEWRGGTVATQGGGLGGASAGVFSYDRAGERRPVIGFDRCRSLRISGLTLDGDPGPGIGSRDVTAWRDADGPNDDPYIALSNAFLRATRCDDVRVENGALAPERCSREMWTVVDCEKVAIRGLVSHSKTNNFASLAKVIRCRDVDISGIRVSDPGSGSLVDVIATRFRYADVDVDYPNGKLLDVSQEWREFNAPIDAGLIENCRTTGLGVVSVRGKSTEEDRRRGAIGEVRLRDVTAFGGDGGAAKSPALFAIPRARKVAVEGCRMKNMAPTITRGRGPGGKIAITDCVLEWDDAAAAEGRAFAAAGPWTWTRTTLRGASASGPVELILRSPRGGSGRHAFAGCRFENVVLRLEAPATFEDCAFVNATTLEG